MAHKANRTPEGGAHQTVTPSSSSDHSAQDRPALDRPAGYDPAVEDSVETSRLLSLSSFGAPEARDERMLGRIETEKHLARQIGSPGPRHISGRDLQVEMDAADKLEARGYTFEAQLRYRRLASMIPLAATRLGMLLEVVGRREEAWRFYLRAAQSDEPYALLRLAVICHLRGELVWALRLMRHAYAQLPMQARRSISDQVYHACLARPASTADRANEFGSRVVARTNRARMDAVFGLGSFFFIAANRPDLARLAYCSALGRGSSLAAVSLIDMTPYRNQFSGTGRSRYLQQFLADGLDLSRYRAYDDRWVHHDGAEIDRYSALFLSRAQTAPMSALSTVLTEGRRDSREFIEAHERVLIIARTATMILGYRRVGTHKTLPAIRRAADKACSTLTRRITDQKDVHDGGSLITTLWECAKDEVERIPASTNTATANSATTDAANSGSTTQMTARPVRSRYVPGSGVAHRIGEQFQRLPDDQTRIITQRVAGIYQEEVADAMGVDIGVTRGLYRDGITLLREAHGGQQLPTSEQLLWHDVETSFLPAGLHDDGLHDDGLSGGAPGDGALRAGAGSAPSGALPDVEEIRIDAGRQECPARW
jgi:hypothetical protein